MRKTIRDQLSFGEVCIEDIQFDLRSRDEIPKILMGLQAIYCQPEVRDEIFALLEAKIQPCISKKNGRPGMELWKILVLGCIRVNSNLDYDRLQELANQHLTLREMLGHAYMDKNGKYPLQTLKDNLSLFTPDLLNEINQVVAKFGLSILKKKRKKSKHIVIPFP